MSKLYYLKVKDELVGTISYPELKFIRNKDYKKSLPLGLAPWKSEYTYEPNKDEVLKFLKSRVVQENNQGILIIMKELGYGAYNLEALLDETCGMNFNDFIWVLPEEKKDWDFNTYHMRVHPELYIECN